MYTVFFPAIIETLLPLHAHMDKFKPCSVLFCVGHLGL